MTEEEKRLKALEDAKLKEKTVEEIQAAKILEMKKQLDKAVDPVEHAKLKLQYKDLLDEMVNKRPVIKQEEVKLRPAKEIATELKNIKSGDISNRDYIAKTLEYRNSHISEFGTDPFADGGEDGAGEATDNSIEVAGKLQKLVDENPSPVDFRIKLNSVLKDDSKLVSALNKRKNRKK